MGCFLFASLLVNLLFRCWRCLLLLPALAPKGSFFPYLDNREKKKKEFCPLLLNSREKGKKGFSPLPLDNGEKGNRSFLLFL